MQPIPPIPGVAKPDPVLRVDGLLRRFGGVTAVDVDHLEIQRGSITALIGPNGAGKTTLFNLLTCFDRPDAGTWTLDGNTIVGVPSHRIARRGMVRTFQLTKAFPRLSVLENVMLAAQRHPGERLFGALGGRWRSAEVQHEQRARELLQRFGLTAKAGDYAGGLSGGQRKLLEFARALMVEPDVVMLDEPMAGVNPALTASLLGHVAELRDEGRTVIYVEHDMDVVMEISDWVVVLAESRVIAEGTTDHVAADPLVVDAYLGTIGTEPA
jgi:branched-chain amino acid transport system ATP-binding protein